MGCQWCCCERGRAQLCISSAFSGGSLAMGMNSSRNHHRPPHRVQRAFCLPWEGKTTHSQINRDKTTQAAAHLAPRGEDNTTNTHQMLATWLQARLRDAPTCCTSLWNKTWGSDSPVFSANINITSCWGNGTQCCLPSNWGASLIMVNISVKAAGTGVNVMMERAPLFIFQPSLASESCTEAGDTVS